MMIGILAAGRDWFLNWRVSLMAKRLVISRISPISNGLMWAFSLGIMAVVVNSHASVRMLSSPLVWSRTGCQPTEMGCKAVWARDRYVDWPGNSGLHYSSINLFAHRCSLVPQ